MRHFSDGNLPLFGGASHFGKNMSCPGRNILKILNMTKIPLCGKSYASLGQFTFWQNWMLPYFCLKQFSNVNYQYQTTSQTIFTWMIGRGKLQDKQCLWVH